MGVAVNHENLWHMTALHEAARGTSTTDRGLWPRLGWTRVETARRRTAPPSGNQATMIRVLVEEFGADMEIRDLDGYKPIHTACTESAVEAIR